MMVVANQLNDAGRLAALRRTALLESPVDAAFDRLTRLAARVIGAPVALVSLVAEDHQFFKSCIGLPEPWASRRQTPLSHSFCQHTVVQGAPLVIEDARGDPLVRDNLAIPDIGVVAYAGIPLITTDGYVLGTFCVIDHEPRRWTPAEIETLTDLAAAVMTEIELRTTIALAEAESHARQEAERALHASETWLDLAVESANVGVWDLDLVSGAITCSAQGRAMFGVAPETEMTYPLLMSLIHDDDRDRVIDMADESFRDRALYGAEFRILRPDGAVRWIAATGRGLYDEAGAPVRLAGIVVDVTDQKRAEEQQRFFVDAAAHDLKGPLTTIKGQSQLLRRRLRRGGEPDRARLTGGLDAIDAAADKASLIITELLDAAHLRAGRALDLDRRPFDLVATARTAAADQARAASKQTVRVETRDDEIELLGDLIRIERVIVNLLTNAIKYSPDGGVITVTVGTDTRGDEPWAVLAVRDEGIGIPAADLPHIFERFRRGSNVGTIDGDGVGLAGVKQIVEQHGGEVGVESEEGRGSTFTIRLPRGEVGG